jgi:hypothetical protein
LEIEIFLKKKEHLRVQGMPYSAEGANDEHVQMYLRTKLLSWLQQLANGLIPFQLIC